MKKNVEPTLGSGFRDYLPKDMIPRQKMLDIIRKTFEEFGFLPLDTPGIEREDILTGGDENFKMQIFRIDDQEESEDKFALRFDLTVPLARVISMHRELERPFKRYQTGKVWRGEKPQVGRFREFVQFDADIVGSTTVLADAEMISLIYETMTNLGFENFIIKINNRKILNGLVKYLDIDTDSISQVLRSIDKIDKIGWPGVARELEEKAVLSKEKLSKLNEFLELRGFDHDDTFSKMESLLNNSSTAIEGVEELRKISRYLTSFNIPSSKWAIDLSVVRGLGYYSGTIFETVLLDLPTIGSVFSGGRYDNLISRFSNHSTPATGASIGVDRLFAAMEQLKLVSHSGSLSKVLVLNFDPEAEQAAIQVVSNLRKNEIPSEIYFGKNSTIKEQLAYALRQEIQLVIIIGENEKKRGVAQIKDLSSRKQIEVQIPDILSEVKRLLSI